MLFTNVKVDRMFSRMNWTKTDWQNKPRSNCLASLLQVSEEGVSVHDYNPDPATEEWYQEKIQLIISSKTQHYPKKYRKASGTTQDTIIVARHVQLNLEGSNSSDSNY